MQKKSKNPPIPPIGRHGQYGTARVTSIGTEPSAASSSSSAPPKTPRGPVYQPLSTQQATAVVRHFTGDAGVDQIYMFVDYSNVFRPAGKYAWRLLPGGQHKYDAEARMLDEKVKAAAASDAANAQTEEDLGFDFERPPPGPDHSRPGFMFWASWLQVICCKMPMWSDAYMKTRTQKQSFIFMSQSLERANGNTPKQPLQNSSLVKSLSEYYQVEMHVRVPNIEKDCTGTCVACTNDIAGTTYASSGSTPQQKHQHHKFRAKDPGRGDNHEKGVDVSMALACLNAMWQHEIQYGKDQPGTIILCSSDADFRPLLERLLARKWQVLVWAWKDGIGTQYREWLMDQQSSTGLLQLNFFNKFLFQLGVPRNRFGKVPIFYRQQLLFEPPASQPKMFNTLSLWSVCQALTLDPDGPLLETQQYVVRWPYIERKKQMTLSLWFYADESGSKARDMVLRTLQTSKNPVMVSLETCIKTKKVIDPREFGAWKSQKDTAFEQAVEEEDSEEEGPVGPEQLNPNETPASAHVN